MLIEAFCLKGSPKAKYLPVPSSLANYHCQNPYFSIKSEYENHSAFYFFFFKTLSRIALRYYPDSVTVILTATLCLGYVTCSHRTYYILSRRLVEFSVSKWLKLTQFHLFTSLCDLKKKLCNGETYKKYEKRAFRVEISTFVLFEFGSVHNRHYLRPNIKIPELRWCVTESIQRFPPKPKPIPRYVCMLYVFRRMSKCVSSIA